MKNHESSQQSNHENTHPKITEFLKFREEFKSEDIPYLDSLAKIPKNVLILYFHNFFSLAEGKSEIELERLIKRLQTENTGEPDIQEALQAAKIYLELTKKYDWTVALNLNAIFEEIND